MEKVNYINSRGLNLVGNLYITNPHSNSIIIMCHGFTGNKHEIGRFDIAATKFHDKGYNVLNFDFSGSGESDDDTLTVGKQVDDLESTIKYVQDKGYSNIALLGLSLGGLVSLKVYNPKIKSLVLWAPVTAAHKNYCNRFNTEQLQELNESGYITRTRTKGVRKKILIDPQIIKDRENVDQKYLCSRINCPVLIVHGDQDDRIPLQNSIDALQYFPKNSRLEIISGADHLFFDQVNQFIDLSVEWYKHYFPINSSN
ncbi:alpha/beta hydrolase [archaeon]|jgi:pimeloyl-ACP methyl ester carboxylesterase|nr:alpha/beta hydrolase [archaeon]MBT3450611.1 alpha/beta hydrolase [archaeon]MBT6868703.1 alpha/beta hydrolase [archaeon]MBT7193491.1 alpha/beta hydrolase [archaeon]MBT7381082.1 alpha/beta hydrolase [archaeon]